MMWIAGIDRLRGQAGGKAYVAEARSEGVAVNRARVFVLRSAVCSLSRLQDVVAD